MDLDFGMDLDIGMDLGFGMDLYIGTSGLDCESDSIWTIFWTLRLVDLYPTLIIELDNLELICTFRV